MTGKLASFGAEPDGDGGTRFRLWAPEAGHVDLDIEGLSPIGMSHAGSGWFEACAPCGAGAAYRFCIDGRLSVPDPASRAQRGGVHGRSLLVDKNRYRWRHADWKGRPWRETAIYELHAGCYGGFRGVAESLPRLRDLGVTAVELMPVNAFPGARNWGYDGVLPYAPAEAYGAPDDLKALVDAAHGHGMMIFLDVVYNHLGPDGNYLHAYAPGFFHADRTNAWGASIDFRRSEVRDFFTANVLHWLNEYRFDGLRFDAVHAILESDWLDEMAATARAGTEPDRHIHLMLENDHNIARHLAGNFDAQWNDDAHHVLHVLLTGEQDGYYGDYAAEPAAKLARSLAEGFVYQGEPSLYRGGKPRGEPSAGLDPTAFILFLQNHDQVGNRAFGERLTSLADPQALEAAIALQCLCPQIPLIFMGEEVASRAPFLFFTDHEEQLALAVREGRAREFAAFSGFRHQPEARPLPDPNSLSTFLVSKPAPDDERGAARYALYRRLLSLRASAIVPRLAGAASVGAEAIGEAAVKAAWRLGDGSRLVLAANLGPEAAGIDGLAGDLLHESIRGAAGRALSGSLEGRSAVAFLESGA